MRHLLFAWTTCLALFALACSSPPVSPTKDSTPEAAEAQVEPATVVDVEPSPCPTPRPIGEGNQHVALVVGFGDGQNEAVCIAHGETSLTAYDALKLSGLEMSSQYHAAYDAYTLCRLTSPQGSTSGCSYPDEDCFCDDDGAFWSFLRSVDGAWVKSQTGLAGVQLTSGELFAQHWSARPDPPPTCTFDQVCGVR